MSSSQTNSPSNRNMPASTNPTSLYRWQDAAGLEHACWACPTKSNSPRALQTCYGIHSIPCTAYHPTMHAIGAAHRCVGCVGGREMHQARHRNIAELVVQYRDCTEPIIIETPSKPTRNPRTPLIERNLNIMGNNGALNRAPLTPTDATCNPADENDSDEEETNDSSTSFNTNSSAGSKETPRRTAAEKRIDRKAKKDQKSQQKALKNQDRHVIGVTAADIERVAKVLHGSEADAMSDGTAHPILSDKNFQCVIDRNLSFVNNIQAHKSALFKSVASGRNENKEKKRLKKRDDGGELCDDTIELEQVVSAAMIQLGIPEAVVEATHAAVLRSEHSNSRMDTNPSGLTRKRKGSLLSIHTSTPAPSGKGRMVIAQRLRTAIKEDLEKHDNEIHERYVRAGGFWRYANSTVFDRMMDIAQQIDVGTGEGWEKKRAREAQAASKVEGKLPEENV